MHHPMQGAGAQSRKPDPPTVGRDRIVETMQAEAVQNCRRLQMPAEVFFYFQHKNGEHRLAVTSRPTKHGIRSYWTLDCVRISKADAARALMEAEYF